MAYRPLLGNGPPGQVILTMVLTALGLIAFTACMEQYLMRKLSIIETGIVGLAALAMLWPIYWLSIVGAVLFLAILAFQWLQARRTATVESPA